MNDFGIIKVTEEEGKYLNLLDEIQNYSPFYLPLFFKNFSGEVESFESLICFYYRNKNNELILMPGIISKIPEFPGYYDFSSPYGYSGPIYTNGIKLNDLEIFWKEIDTWHKSNNVITEFIRFSLNSNYIGYTGNLILSLWNIKGKILSEEEQWHNFERKVRKNINRSRNEKLTCNIYPGNQITSTIIEEFYNVYIHTMNRNNVNNRFYYKYENFLSFIKAYPERVLIVSVYDRDMCISTELNLLCENSVYSFLGGTLNNFFSKRPNDFLKYNLINWMRINNKEFYILGGGVRKNDGIFKFKKSFFPNDVVPFYTGRKVINNEVYLYLVDEYKKKIKEIKEVENFNCESDYFPIYRKLL